MNFKVHSARGFLKEKDKNKKIRKNPE